MDIKKTGLKYFLIGLIICCQVLQACKEEEEDYSSRTFTPINLTVNTSGINQITAQWNTVKDATDYCVQNSADSLFTTYTQVNTDSTKCIFSNLINGNKYFLRVKSENQSEDIHSDWQTIHYIFKNENIISNIQIGTDTVKIQWNNDINISAIEIKNLTNDSIRTIELNSEEQTLHEYTLKNLLQNTSYSIKLYSNQIIEADSTLSTKNADSTNNIYLSPSSDIVSIINQAPNNSIIHFSGGTYAFGDSDIIIENKSLSFVSDYNNTDSLPEICIKSITLKGTIGSVIFNNLGVNGIALGGSSPEDLNSYFIDMAESFISADSIIIKNCTIHNIQNCVIRGNRGKGNQSVKKVSFDNCIITNINSDGSQQYETLKLDSLQTNEINLTNCTIYNTSHGLLNNRSNHSSVDNITINNNTINDMGSTSYNAQKYLIELSNSEHLNGIIQNTIFSNLKGYSSSANYQSKGFKFTEGSLNGYNNLFFNMPFTGSEVTDWSLSDGNMEEIDPKYNDSGIGDFTIGNSQLLTLGRNGFYLGASNWINKE